MSFLNFLRPRLISVQVYKDHFVIKSIAKESSPVPVFPDGSPPNRVERTPEALKQAVALLRSRRDLLSPVIVMQAVDIDHPLTEAERKPLYEAAEYAGASRMYVIAEPFHPLSDDEVRTLAGYG